jgi:shikimate kinase/3-dehydroquinate synthase
VARLKPAIVFIGFMGAGKSAALDATRAAGLSSTDADWLLQDELGMPIPDFFETHGEDEFRRREAGLVGELLERADGGAISLGGGAVRSERVRAALERHIVVWLAIDADEAWDRAAFSGRPLARDRDAFMRLFAEREPLYRGLADAVIENPDWGSIDRALRALQAMSGMPSGTRLLWAETDEGGYPVMVGEGILGTGWWPLEGRRFCVTDANVATFHAEALGGVEATVAIPAGEESKTLAETERVLRELARAGMTRSDHVVALGGGVVGDLAGFVAHTYQRGVPVVQVPTSLVAQVDSAYGGKTGVDLPEAKNYVGAYQQPAAVIADAATLRTLPAAERAAGFVEVLKTALLAGGRLWEGVRDIEAGEITEHGWVVFDCARYKCQIVARDERDQGLRAVLNLGHTVGHAIEAATGYRRYRHGEAVALGLLAALRLSGAEALRAEVREILERHQLPMRLDPAVDTDAVLAAVERDKKRTADGVGFVLLERPGEPRIGESVDASTLRGAVEELQV